MTTSEPTTECSAEKCAECCLKCDGDCKGHVESTTGEIVAQLRAQQDPRWNVAADRLESQEQTIADVIDSRSRLVTALAELTMKAGELTARAEKAEKNCDIWEKKWWEEALKKVEVQAFKEKAERERDAAVEMRNNAMRGVEGIKRGQQEGEGV